MMKRCIKVKVYVYHIICIYNGKLTCCWFAEANIGIFIPMLLFILPDSKLSEKCPTNYQLRAVHVYSVVLYLAEWLKRKRAVNVLLLDTILIEESKGTSLTSSDAAANARCQNNHNVWPAVRQPWASQLQAAQLHMVGSCTSFTLNRIVLRGDDVS